MSARCWRSFRESIARQAPEPLRLLWSEIFAAIAARDEALAGTRMAAHFEQVMADLQTVVKVEGSADDRRKRPAASGASSPTRISVALTTMGLPLYRNFEAVTGQAIGFREHGYLFVTGDEAKVPGMKRGLALQQEAGVPARWVSPEDRQ